MSSNGSKFSRDHRGRFLPGNPGGSGNPHAQEVGRLRSALYRAVTPADLEGMVKALVTKARQGDTAAARVVLPYLVGAPPPLEDTGPALLMVEVVDVDRGPRTPPL